MYFKSWLNEQTLEELNLLITLCEKNIFGAEKAKKYRKVLKLTMPGSKKVDHSERVTQDVHSLMSGHEHHWDAVTAALFHDFLERGGNHTVLNKLGLSPRAIQIINALTSDKESADPLEHLETILPTLDEEIRNIVILVKLSDRIDNLKQRFDSGGIPKEYLRKSIKLIHWLFKQYTGDSSYLLIIRQRLQEIGVKARKKFIR